MLKFLQWSLFAVLPLLAVLYSTVPLAAYWAWDDFLEQHQLEGELGHVDWLPRLGQIEIENLSARNAEGRGFHLGGLTLDIQLLPLLERKLLVERLAVTDIQLDARLLQQGLELGGLIIPTTDSSLSRETTTEASADISGWQLQLQQVDINGLKFCGQLYRQGELNFDRCLAFSRLQLQADISVARANPLSLDIAGKVALEQLQLDDRRAQTRTLSFNGLALKGLSVVDQSFALEKLTLNDIAFAERHSGSRDYQQYNYHSRLKQLQLDNFDVAFSADRPELSLAKIELTDLDMLLYRNKQVELPLAGVVDDLIDQSVERREQKQSGPAPIIRIGEVALSGDSKLRLVDEAIEPNLEQRLTNIQLKLGRLDSESPEARTPLSISSRFGDYGEIALDGWGKPFDDKINVEFKGGLSAIELSPFSPYSERATGYKLKQGLLDNSFKLAITDNNIDSLLELTLRKIKLKDLAPEERTADSGQTSVPLDMGLMLLKDRQGNIELDLPIAGDVAAPDFSMTDAMMTVTTKIVTTAVINYYTPFGLVSAADFVAGEAFKLRFEPMVFSAGQSSFDLEPVDKLAELLLAKPQLSLVVCPVANGADWLALQGLPAWSSLGPGSKPAPVLQLNDQQKQSLKALAKQRGVSVKGHILQTGVAANQVILCKPELQLQQFSAPQASVEV